MQRRDIALQALDLPQLQLDLVLVGGDGGAGVSQLAGRLVGARRRLLLLSGERRDAGRQLVALGLRALQLIRQLRRAEAQFRARFLFECEQAGELVDLLLQFVQRLVAPGQGRRQVKLAGGEHQEDEDDHHQ